MTSSRSHSSVGLNFLKLGTGEALARIVAFGVTVYLARRVGADAYGMVILAMSVMAYVGRVADCGVDQLGVRDLAHDPTQASALIPTYLGARMVMAIPLTILTAGAALLLLPLGGTILAAFAFTILPMAVGTRWVHIGLDQPGIVAIVRTAQECFIALLVVALVHGPEDVGWVPAAAVTGEAASAFLLLRALPGLGGATHLVLSFATVKALYRRSWPLVYHALLGLIIMNSDFFVLRLYRDSATVGHYAVAYTLISFLVNLGHSYQMSLLPVVTRAGNDPREQSALCRTAAAHVFAVTWPLAVGGFLVADRLLPAVFGSAYLPAVVPMQVLVWSIPVALTRNVIQSLLIARGQQDLMMRTSAWAAGSNLALNFAIIPFAGMRGAAAVTLVTELVRLVALVASTWRSGVHTVSLSRMWRTLFAGGAMALILATVPVPVWVAIPLGTAVYVSALWLLGGLRFGRGVAPELVV